jgi:chromate reductase, NAD(P)H dehydrogenase (quinone)
VRVLAISGSLRRDSYNTQLLRFARELAPASAEIELYEDLAEIPPYDQDVQDAHVPAAVADLRERIAAADALLIATPEYNGSVPGVLKNAIDWASRPFPDSSLRNKPVAVVGASTGAYGGVWAQADLRKILGIAGARVVGGSVAIPHAAERFDADGRLVDAQLRQELGELLRDLTTQTELRVAA